ncbi:MAG: thermonuclease family protein [Scytolyngbya sp. HA4215-MV1]|jgi:endonuclease YncB( thermonuclease family)|nr:thermonuclease family protein [Scytolyngbya sp. HA4215-MV1]
MVRLFVKLAIAGVSVALIGLPFYHQWQVWQGARPDYDRAIPVKRPLEPEPGLSQHWQVVRVSDGDTIVVQAGGRQDKIRFCGIDAPELEQPLGKEAQQSLQRLIQAGGNQVMVTPTERDREGRLVGEVFVAAPTAQQPELEKFLNAEMVRLGMAYHYAKFSDGCLNRDEMVAGEQEAQQQRRGVWGESNAVKPWDWRQQH